MDLIMQKAFIHNALTDTTLPLPSGLFAGKAGICLYLFHAGHEDLAHEWLQTINRELPAMKGCITVEEGLSGVGIAISHLVRKGFIRGDINAALREIDDRVFQQLAYERHSKKYSLTALIHILYYLTSRWKDQAEGSDSEYIFKSLITKTVNNLYGRIDPQSICEPLHYSLDYALPQVLYIMDYLLSLNLCRQRIERMMGELSPVILSTIPRIEGNRLYLLCAINALLSHGAFSEEWRRHASILFSNIDVNHILTKEMGCKSIYISNGLSSLYFLIAQVREHSDNMDEYRKLIMERIDNSPEWKLLAENRAYLRSHLGLHNGVCGVALARNIMDKQNERRKPL